MTAFDAIKQVDLNVFCEVMFGIAKDAATQDELKEALQTELTEEALQQINEAALREGYQPLICRTGGGEGDERYCRHMQTGRAGKALGRISERELPSAQRDNDHCRADSSH